MIFNVKSLLGMEISPAEPLGNRKNALLWLSELPADDIVTAQSRIVEALKQLTEAKTSQKEETNRLEIIDALDHHVQALQVTLCNQYLRSPRMSQSMENRLWNTIYAYYIVISQVYYYHLQAQVAQRNLHAVDALMVRLALRSLFNLGNAFKWRFIRYSETDVEMWGMLNSIYRIAEKGSFAQLPGTIYDMQPYRCNGLFLRTQMLALAHPSSLHAEQIDQLDQWLLTATDPMTLEKVPKPSRHHYFVDLGEQHGALPVIQVEYSSDCRGWDMSTLLIQLQRSKSDLIQGKPHVTNNPIQQQKLLNMLEYAEKQWYPGHLGKLRKTSRVKSGRELESVLGLPAVCAVIKHSIDEYNQEINPADINYTETLDLQMYGFVTESTRNRQQQSHIPPTSLETTEQWETENESATGYLVRYLMSQNNGLHLGSLAGIREKGSHDWQVCVVRRLLRTQQMTSLAGVEALAHHPVVVTLLPIEPEQQTAPSIGHAPSQGQLNQAVMLQPIRDSHFTVIIDSIHYAQSRLYKFQLVPNQQFTYFRLGHIIEKGDLWIHADALVIREEAK